MKRALAERAKQSGLPNGVAPATPATETKISSTASPGNSTPTTARKLPSSGKPVPAITTSSTPQPSSPKATSTVSPRPKKRLRESVVKLEEEDEDDSNASAFYLRHQNRALASELRTLKYELSRIERERDYRRAQCSEAVQSLNSLQATWTQMEAALQCEQPTAQNEGGVVNVSGTTAPISTGSGKSVELIGALLDSLAALGTTRPNKRRRRIRGDSGDKDEKEDGGCSSEDNEEVDDADTSAAMVDDTQTQQLDDLLRITDNVSQRASTLQRWIWSVLKQVESSQPNSSASTAEPDHLQQIATMKAKNETLKAQLKELARSRDEMADSDRRVRRGLYRLAAGRVQLKEVLKAIVTSDEDKEAAAAWMEVTPTPTAVVSTSSIPSAADVKVKIEGDKKDKPVNSAQLAQLKKEIVDLEQVASTRDDQIKKLLSEREEQIKRINSLVLKEQNKTSDVPTDQEVQKSDLYAQMMAKIAAGERKVQELEVKSSKITEEWSQALANAELAKKTIEDMQSKHMKRWADLVKDDSEMVEGKVSEDAVDEMSSDKKKAEEIITLQHKLTQALENVRQAETTRKTLVEAVAMNEALQAKLEEVKSKYAALQQGRASSSNNHAPSSTSGGASTPKGKGSSSSVSVTAASQSAEKSERSEKSENKLHRNYRRVCKELAAATASKEAAKAKLERAEKERESLNQTNCRLLKQAAEKDDMNAKSLSTILHLKQLTDQITKEKENLEQQVKSSQQVALGTRLASNARERLSEEFDKDRKALETRIIEKDQECAELAKVKEQAEGKLSQQKAKMSGLMTDVDKAKGRCEELASESTKLQEEKHKMMESLAIAKKESAEALKLSERLANQSGGGGMVSGFTAEQLNTQVSVLKSRLACPVCNHRDKKCILLRCRHMFCKQCVDENIKNRSRKCPACGSRFDTKDVADVWL